MSDTVCLKISGIFLAVFLSLSARDLKQNCKPNVSKVRKISRNLEGEGVGATPIHNMEGERDFFHGEPSAYLENLKPILPYRPVICKGRERFLWRARSLSGRPETKCAVPTGNMEG